MSLERTFIGAMAVSTKTLRAPTSAPYPTPKPGYGRLANAYPAKSQDTRSLTAAFPGYAIVNHRHAMLDVHPKRPTYAMFATSEQEL